ncbi:MAG: ABC transporter ATP-binding protein [Lachnospiraceae bacterium]
MKLMINAIRKHLGMFLTAIFFLSIETMADLLQPTFMSYIVDNGVKGQDISKILQYGGIMLGIAAAGAFGAVMRNIYASRTSQTIGKEMRADIYKKVQTLSFENIDRLKASSIITRITNDVTQIQNFINGTMRIMMKAPITCIGAIVLIILQTPRQLPMMIIIIGIAALLIGANMKLGYPRFGRQQRKLDRLNEVSREFLSSIRVVKAFSAEEQEEEKFGEAAADFSAAGVSATRVAAVFSPLINLTVNMGIVVLLWISGIGEAGKIGRTMASVNYMTQVLFSLGMVSNILNAFVRAVASAERVEEILKEEPTQKNVTNMSDNAGETGGNNQMRGTVVFRNVTFSYADTGRPSIQGLDFTVKPGETIGIIGPTGSGKSTLVNLIPRFYDATEGQVLVDGRDVTEWNMEELRKSIAVVPQKALLFSGTIEANLRWGKQDATREELVHAAKIACADTFVEGFADKYETNLGQGGVNLSGGQKQRLSIARALLKNPRILILDDCTSALDASTEAAVLAGLREQADDMTVFLISQRISTVMKADRILCMEDGQMKGLGTHKELLAGCLPYRAIYESQIGGGFHG